MNYTKGILGEFLSNISNKNFRTLRLNSMALDHMVMTSIVMIPSITLFFIKTRFNYNIDNLLFPVILFIYINKNTVKCRSIGKRLQGYKIVKVGTTQIASSLQCYLRNIVIPILWPLEVVITYFSPNRRLGDLISGTEVVIAEKESILSIFIDLRSFKISFQIVWVIIAGLIYSYLFNYLK